MVGGALVGLRFLFGPPALLAMRRAETALSPDEPTTAIVDRGPFRSSRNPIDLSFTLLYAGIATFANALWALLFLPGVLVLIHRQVVEREEPDLERVFGAEYLRYQQRVRRWMEGVSDATCARGGQDQPPVLGSMLDTDAVSSRHASSQRGLLPAWGRSPRKKGITL